MAERFWCDYRDLEEFPAGMWRRVSPGPEKDELLARAVAHLRDREGFRAAMRRALAEWPTSCLSAFTNPLLNKANWLAHAGAALVGGIPEELMRLAYWRLDKEERRAADEDAALCAAEWCDPRGVGA